MHSLNQWWIHLRARIRASHARHRGSNPLSTTKGRNESWGPFLLGGGATWLQPFLFWDSGNDESRSPFLSGEIGCNMVAAFIIWGFGEQRRPPCVMLSVAEGEVETSSVLVPTLRTASRLHSFDRFFDCVRYAHSAQNDTLIGDNQTCRRSEALCAVHRKTRLSACAQNDS